MNFDKFLLDVLKRVAKSDYAHASFSFGEDGAFELELLAIVDGQVGSIATVNERATDAELRDFELQIDALDKFIAAQAAEDEANEKKIREILERLTPNERALIERPLPEDLPPEADGEEHF
jgi:uncharacterized coiled-coil protein SlyX